MKTHKILLLFCLLAASFSLVEGARRKNGSRHLSRRNPKAKITLGACSKRCKRLGGRCGKPKPPKKDNACKDRPVDLVFILDGSSSVGPKNFTVVKEFMSKIVGKFSVKPGGVRVALHQYSSANKQRLEFNLDRYDTKPAVLEAINNIEWITGDTHTAKALTEVRTQIIEPASRNSPNRERMVLVITDGDPQDFKRVPAAVDALKPFDVKIYAIGVGDATVSELKKIGWTGEKSDKKDVWYAEDYRGAQKFLNMLVESICA